MTELRPLDPALEFLPRERIEGLQLRRLRRLLRHVAATNPFYADLWRAAGVDAGKVRTFADFRAAIPLVDKADLLRDQQAQPPFGRRVTADPRAPVRREVYTTSGTSGQGVEVHVQSRREAAVMERMYRHYFRWAGLGPGDPVLLTVPVTLMAGGRAEYQGALAHELTVYPAGNYDAPRKLELVRRFQPRALFGSSSYFGHLAALAGDEVRGLGIEILLTGMEGCGLSYLRQLEERWGARAADRFGCTQMRADFMFTDERGIGEPGRPGVLFNMDPYVYLEVLDPSTGQPVTDGEFGELVVTSLYHLDNPVVRNRLGDGAVYRRGGMPGASRAFSGVEVASVTRMDDVKKVKGVNLYPQAVDELLYAQPEVEQYEVVLSSAPDLADAVTLNVQLRAGAGPEDVRTRLARLLRDRMGIAFDVQVVAAMAVSEYKARRWRDLRLR